MEMIFAAFSAGFAHAFAPDHWIPLVLMASARKWSAKWVAAVTFAIGCLHVLSSFVLAWAGSSLFHFSYEKILGAELARADLAGTFLMGFGVAYMLWAARKWFARNHANPPQRNTCWMWAFYLILTLGPCEPLIPFVVWALPQGAGILVFVTGVFAVATIATMILLAVFSYKYIPLLRSLGGTRAADLVTGGGIALTGAAVRLLGI